MIDLNQPAITRWILDHTPQGGRVLDIGCGDGELLGTLVHEKKVRGTGIELSEELVLKAVRRGLSVHHGNVDEGLDHYGDKSFDLVILSSTLQELSHPVTTLKECHRVGKQVLVVFPNFAYWRSRLQLLCGRLPLTDSLPYSALESPNRHYLTVADWESFCNSVGYRVLDSGFVGKGSPVGLLPNLFAEVALYLLDGGSGSAPPPNP